MSNRWIASRWRTAFWALIAFDALYEYMIRRPGLFGTVIEHLAVAAIALSCVWEGFALRAEQGVTSRG